MFNIIEVKFPIRGDQQDFAKKASAAGFDLDEHLDAFHSNYEVEDPDVDEFEELVEESGAESRIV